MDSAVIVQDLDPEPVVAIRRQCPPEAVPDVIRTGITEHLERLRLLGVRPTGDPFVLYHEMEPGGFDVEVCVPVPGGVSAAGGIESRVLPAMTVARVTHVGPYEELGETWETLAAWIGSHGYEGIGPVRERYRNGPADGVDPSGFRTEIERAVVPVPLAAAAR